MAQGIFNLKQVNQAIRQNAWSGIYAPTFVEYLVVAGGGGGSGNNNNGWGAGGGGAGGLRTGIIPVTAGTSYAVTVGSGGATTSGPTNASSGTNSVFSTIISVGGGYGAVTTVNGATGGNGGSGGGGSGFGLGGTANTSFQGNNGGAGAYPSTYGGGGGGGAGSAGGNGLPGGTGSSAGGKGGAGVASSISGTVITYAGGGGGSTYNVAFPAGAGGSGGGGAGSADGNGTNGIANSGGGGGAGSATAGNKLGGIGGSGIVIVRYQGTVQFYTGGTVNYANGYIIHTFYSNGTLAPTTPTQYSNTYQISRSLRFNMADPAYLKRTPTVAGNRKTWTLSVWLKRAEFKTTNQPSGILTAGTTNSTWIYLRSESDGGLSKIDFYDATVGYVTTDASYRDASAWYHFVFVMDTTNANKAERMKIYVNGVVQTTTIGTAPVLNADSAVNTTDAHWYGVFANENTTNSLGAYMAELNFIDGQALTPSSFGEYDVNTGVWGPKAYTGTYGTNGHYLNFSDNSNTTAATLGADTSGNGNNWTPNNFSVSAGVGNDSFVDTPTQYGTDTGVGGEVRGNYCTVNAVAKTTNMTLTNGNLDCVSSDTDWAQALGTIGMSSGKWYFEVTKVNAGGGALIGIAGSSVFYNASTYIYQSPVGYLYYQTGQKYSNNVDSAYGASYTAGDVVGVAFDADAGTLVFYKNGASQGTAFSGLTSGPYLPAILPNNTTGNLTCNFGQRPFAYTAPSGFKALCTQNLPTPTIGATAATRANKYFNSVLWTGTGTAGKSVSGVGFQPDFIWMKKRSAGEWHGLVDSVRGSGRFLFSNETTAEGYYPTDFASIDIDGFSFGTETGSVTNGNGSTYVAWNWKAGGTAVTNTAGSITSTVSANPTAGFSIVTYTGVVTATVTIGHGLGVAPSFIIVKNRSTTSSWYCYHSALGATYRTNLNTTAASFQPTGLWNSTPPTSTVFTTVADTVTNSTGDNHIAYCFAAIAGYSAFGSYIGNGSTNGPFVHTGFRPRFILWKNSTSVYDWQIVDTARDTYNASGIVLQPNASNAEADGRPQLDILSNGFKIRASSSVTNESASTFIYMAFAENPFKYSLAR